MFMQDTNNKLDVVNNCFLEKLMRVPQEENTWFSSCAQDWDTVPFNKRKKKCNSDHRNTVAYSEVKFSEDKKGTCETFIREVWGQKSVRSEKVTKKWCSYFKEK